MPIQEIKSADVLSFPSKVVAVKRSEAPNLDRYKENDFISFFASGTIEDVREENGQKVYFIKIEQVDLLRPEQISGEGRE